MKHLRLAIFFIGLILFVNQNSLYGQEQKIGKNLIQQAIGEANKWPNTRYLLYTVTGPSVLSGFSNQRTFLIDKNTGDCRFEGVNKDKENITLLFNYKTKTVKKYFINTQEGKDNLGNLLENILNQFFIDTQILFLPTFLFDNASHITEVSQKIVNTDKINVVHFTKLPTLGGNTIDGEISLTNKGEIKSIAVANIEYTTSASKDIGEGILLPTVFVSQSTYNFQTVAAFTDVETGKFSNL